MVEDAWSPLGHADGGGSPSAIPSDSAGQGPYLPQIDSRSACREGGPGAPFWTHSVTLAPHCRLLSVREMLGAHHCEGEFQPGQRSGGSLRGEGMRLDGPSAVGRLRRLQALGKLVGEAPSFVKGIARLPSIALASAPALLLGETGTGKELVARAIHYLSDRAAQPFVPVNCGTLPDPLLEDEFFGHERGAYTDARVRRDGLIAQAAGGTLFLDEVDSLTPRAQVALLRVFQDNFVRPLGSSVEQRVDVRFIAATNSDLAALVRNRAFREDLYYRLCVFQVQLPPLRERREDVLPLARHFLHKHALRDRITPRLSPDAEAALLASDWPGNVRELENAIVRGMNTCEGDWIEPADLGTARAGDPCGGEAPSSRSFRDAKREVVAAFERSYLARLIAEHHGNVSHAARTAGKERRELGRLLKKYQLNPRDYAQS